MIFGTAAETQKKTSQVNGKNQQQISTGKYKSYLVHNLIFLSPTSLHYYWNP